MSRHWRVLLVPWSALCLSAPAAELCAQDVERAAMQTIEDVCVAVGCDNRALAQSTAPALQRLTQVQAAVCGGDLNAVYRALDAPADPALPGSVDRTGVLEALCDSLKRPPVRPVDSDVLAIPQAPVPHPHPYLLERSMLFPFQQDLILEAQVAPHLYFYDGLTREGVRLKGGNAVAVSVTPMFKVRIRNEPSSPVQTLSFMPKLNFQYFRLPRKPADVPWPDGFWMKGALFVWGHHSNGQTQCIYDPTKLDGAPDCKGPPDPADVQINYPNGSFSTNYLRFSLFLTKMRLGKLAPVAGRADLMQKVAYAKTTIAANLEVNPPGLPPGGSLDEPARSLYGPTRVGLLVEHEQRTSRRRGFLAGGYRLTGIAEFIDKTPDAGSSRWRFTAETAFEPDWFRSGGFVARYIYGQDYYNLQFTRNISWFQFGLIFSASEFEPFLARVSR